MIKKTVDVSSSEDSVDEKSEALLFQMQYVVAAGNFMINLHGRNITADRSSFEHISSSITCGAGYETAGSGEDCVACPVGKFRDDNSLRCNLCEKGSYQDEEGKANCKTCTEGKTTKWAGATSSKECYKEKSISTKKKVEPDDKAYIYYIIASAGVAAVLLLIIIAWYRSRQYCCFTKPVSTNHSHSYRPDNKVSALSHYNQAYTGDPSEEKYYKPKSDKEQDPIYDEITDGINTYASLKSAGLQKRDSSHYAGLCYAPNSVSHYQNVPPYSA